jgi:nicotinate-nucleotide adenylyltransferase
LAAEQAKKPIEHAAAAGCTNLIRPAMWADSLQRRQSTILAEEIRRRSMDHYITVTPPAKKLAILAGAFNPPTRAHLAMADAALAIVDEVLFALPRAFPHKEYSGSGFETRVELLRAALGGNPRFSLASTEGGLFSEIAQEAREVYGSDTELFFLCGRDAAERIVGWDYGEGKSIRKQLESFELLVASRGGAYEPPVEIRERVRSIAIPAELDEVSSSEVRRRIRVGEPWRHLVPGSVVWLVEQHRELW